MCCHGIEPFMLVFTSLASSINSEPIQDQQLIEKHDLSTKLKGIWLIFYKIYSKVH